MSEPFLSEIRIVSFNFAPSGWAFCNGQLLPINQNVALFSLLGTTFGGDGQTTFALPDLRGRTPIHAGNGHTLGGRGGSQGHTLSVNELPPHTHTARVSATRANTPVPASNLLADSAPNEAYHPAAALRSLAPSTVSNVGGSQTHLNMQPFLALTFVIALQGIFPSPN